MSRSPADRPSLIWGGYRLDRSDIETSRYARILQWCVGGSVGFLAINLLTMVFFPWYSLAGNISWAHFSVNAGAVGGFAVGYVEARAIQREVEATVATVRADQLANERELLLYLNDLLRHEVLNSAQIISGHASLLQAECDDERVRTRLETVERESDDLVDVIDDIRAMLEANRGPETHSTVDLTALLTAQVPNVVRASTRPSSISSAPRRLTSRATRGSNGSSRTSSRTRSNTPTPRRHTSA